MNEKNQESLQRWLPVIVSILSCIVIVSVAWGSFSSRLAAVEQQTRDGITRHEYDDLKERMTRIEKKLDDELSRNK